MHLSFAIRQKFPRKFPHCPHCPHCPSFLQQSKQSLGHIYFPCSLLPAPCSLLPAPCSLLPAPCSL
ncbi:hypothetical protein [Moorena producens]|uniref:hypothetical protein n=1 Tax=Moorena producens TaxID=1155739 RepID=UPI000A758A07|nr:hypothetical protein [Moorena producens]